MRPAASRRTFLLGTGRAALLLLGCPAARQAVAAPGGSTSPLVTVKCRAQMGRPESLEGRVVTQDQSGGILLEDRLGTYWALESQEILSQSPGNGDFACASPDELSASLAAAAGTGAAVSKTRRYVLVSQASKAYTNWCGSLLERLQNGFRTHWERDKLPLTENSGPLPVLIFRTRSQFAEYAVRDGAGAVAESFGYYSARTNRIALYDLTAEESGVPLGEAATREEVTRRLSRFPASVATVVHEATHQVAFNSGLQVRYADNPMWLSEGLAMYFETPDFASGGRWTTAGKPNGWRIEEYRKSAPQRAANSLETLVRNEDRFRDPTQMNTAYAESWALVHFLAGQRRADFVTYLKTLGTRAPLVFDAPEERLASFRAAFGHDLPALGQAVDAHINALARRR